MWNIQKSGLEKMSGCVCVCVCVLKLQKIQASVSQESFGRSKAKIWCAPEVDAALPLVSFSLKFIYGLGFYDNLNLLKNFCSRSSYRKF